MVMIKLDDEAEKYLIEILVHEQIPSQELVKKLLYNHFVMVRSPQTILEKMGGYPEDLLDDESNLSDRDKRQQKISKHLQERTKNSL